MMPRLTFLGDAIAGELGCHVTVAADGQRVDI